MSTPLLSFALRGLRRSGPPIHLTLFVTGACNLRCRHCFHWREVEAGLSGPSPEDVERLAASCGELGPLLWVSLTGGEPFLRRDLPRLARSFGSRGLRHLAVPTNGLVAGTAEVAARMADENPETFVSVSVSFDGPPQVHDGIRQVPGGHAKSMEAVRELKAVASERENLGVGIITCVTSENQEVLAEHMVELVEELGPDHLTVNLARNEALDRSLLAVDLQRYRDVCEAKARLEREGRLPGYGFALSRLMRARDRRMGIHLGRVAESKPGARLKGHLPCTAGSLSAVIFENGDVHPCEILGESMGNLGDTNWDLEPLWNSERARDLRTQIAKTRCRCTWECAQGDNILFSPRAWPGLMAEALLPGST
ncbi:MAG: MoaA/NifB/PqqE/SkfB family radical SAM enzyme [Planctomycetota bacterium]|jgi:MoaA/NifB/PqqE/SkfB family radical SAM enzyme